MYTQFHSMQASIYNTEIDDKDTVIFYSYNAPVLKSFEVREIDGTYITYVLIDPDFMSFSRTTSKQLSRYLREEFNVSFLELKATFKEEGAYYRKRNTFFLPARDINPNENDETIACNFTKKVQVTELRDIQCLEVNDLLITEIESF